MTNLPAHLTGLQRLFDQIAEPARVECPLCKGRGETYTFERERPCSRCNSKGTIPAAEMAEAALARATGEQEQPR